MPTAAQRRVRRAAPWVAGALLASALSCHAILGIEDRPAKPAGSTGGAGGSAGGTAPGGGLPNGEPCAGGADCASGYCVDEVCCVEACGQCEVCNAGGAPGACTTAAPGSSAEPECPGGVCDGAGQCAVGNVLWARRFGADGDDWATKVLRDQDGSVIVVGYFTGIVDFGGPDLQSYGGQDVFVAKLDADGGDVWRRQFGGIYRDQPRDAVIRPNGNIVVVGYAASEVSFDGVALGHPHADGLDAFVVEIDADGGHVWSHLYGGLENDTAVAVALDGTGALVVAGFTHEQIQFEGGPLLQTGLSNVDDHRYFVARLDANHGHLWSRLLVDVVVSVPGAWPTPFVALGTDSTGDVVLGGNYLGSASFDGTSLVAAGGGNDVDGFVTKLSAAGGTALWALGFGGTTDDRTTSVRVDAEDRIYVTGFTNGDGHFGSEALTGHGDDDAFLARLDGSGQVELVRLFGAGDTERGEGLALDQAGNAVLAGTYWDAATDFGGPVLSNAGGADVFVAKLAAGGTELVHLWSFGFGTSAASWGRDAAVGPAGTVAVAGSFNGLLTLGDTDLYGEGGSDAFVGLLAP